MTPSQPTDSIGTRERTQTVREERPGGDPNGDRQPQPWTAPDFVEHRVCAEIGAYIFVER